MWPAGGTSRGRRIRPWITDLGSYVEAAQRAVAERVTLPAGYTLAWSGQYEYMQRAQRRLALIIPLTLLLISAIIYFNAKSVTETLFVVLGTPFALTGAIWLLYVLGYNLSIAVWVGIIALAGLYAETAIVLLLYLDISYRDYRDRGLLTSRRALASAVKLGTVKRVRPILMTIATDVIGPASHHVEHGRGRGRDEADRDSACGRRGDLRPRRPDRLPGGLLPLEGARTGVGCARVDRAGGGSGVRRPG